MEPAGSVVLVCMLEPQVVGAYFDRSRWPLHITMLPWFEAPQDVHDQLRQGLRQFAQTQPPVDITAGDQAVLGPQQVNLVVNTPALQAFHQSLLDLIHLLQLPVLHADWTGEHFTPHVSQYENRNVHPGDQLRLDTLYMVELQRGATCQIIGTFELKGHIPDA